MKRFLHLLTLLSLLFLAYYLYTADILHIPTIYSYPLLGLSLLMLLLGFVAQVYTWKVTLQQAGFAVDSAICFAGTGMSVFAKYIPGKVMVIVGRASYVTEKYGYPLPQMTALSLTTQLITLWTGLSIGLLGLTVAGGYAAWWWLSATLWLALTVSVFSNWVNRLLSALALRLLRKKVSLPHLAMQQVFPILGWYIINWLLWAAGFYLLCTALSPNKVSLLTGFGYPLAITLGIAAMLTPGGLGVREGILVVFLKIVGMDTVTATTIAVASRLWFLVGECGSFVMGLVANRSYK